MTISTEAMRIPEGQLVTSVRYVGGDGGEVEHTFSPSVSIDEARDFVFEQMDAADRERDSQPGADGVG